MKASLPHARYLLRLCGVFLISLTVLYFHFAVLPSYQSGLYRLSRDEIWNGHFEVPGYTFEPTHGEGNWRVSLALSSMVAVLYLVVPLMLVAALMLFLGRHTLSRTEKGFWLVVGFTILVVVWRTAPAAGAFATWIMD